MKNRLHEPGTRMAGRGNPALAAGLLFCLLALCLLPAHQAQAGAGLKVLFVEKGADQKHYLAAVNPDGTGCTRMSRGYFTLISPRYCPATGAILFTVHDEAMKSSVHVLHPEASPEKIIDGAFSHCWSPDGASFLYSPSGTQCNLYRYTMATKKREALTKGMMVNDACWSPDGAKIAFSVMEDDGAMDLFLYTLKGARQEKLTQTPGASEHSPGFSPDGRSLVYCHQPFKGLAGCGPGWLARIELATRRVTPLPVKEAYSPSLSPDGQWIVFEEGSGTDLLGICRADGSARRKLPLSGTSPAWMK
jgi:hypothetical protein